MLKVDEESGRAGDEAKKRKSPAKSGRVGISADMYLACNGALYGEHNGCAPTIVSTRYFIILINLI